MLLHVFLQVTLVILTRQIAKDFLAPKILYIYKSYKARGDGKQNGWNLNKYARPLQNSPNNNKISVQDIVYKHYLKTDV